MDFIFHFIIKTRFLSAFIDFSLLEVEILFLFYWWLSLSSQIDTEPSNDEVKSKITCNCLTVGDKKFRITKEWPEGMVFVKSTVNKLLTPNQNKGLVN